MFGASEGQSCPLMERQMTTFYRIECPAYFSARTNAEQPANSFLVNGEASRDLHIAQIADKGCADFKVTELTPAEYRAAALAKLSR
jgi:hypothetical protein